VATTRHDAWTPHQAVRFVWTIVSVFVVESLIVGFAALPTVTFFAWHASIDISPGWLKVLIVSMSIIPSYVIFAIALMALSATTMRLLGWRPPANGSLEIAKLPPELCNWARYMISTYVVRTLVGPFTQATLVWTWYMRMNGAKVGKRVWVNSLGVTDHCNIELGDDVVIGAGVHMSAHTVERGVVHLAPVRVGSGSTIGINSHIQIGVEISDNCQVGSMSLVPKFSQLGPGTWAGLPVQQLHPKSDSTIEGTTNEH